MFAPMRLSLLVLGCSLAWLPACAGADPLLSVTPLEQDRVGPQTPLKGLSLQTRPGKADYFLYNYSKQDDPTAPVLYLRIPYEFVGEASGAAHDFGVHFTVWYPEMTGSLNPANKERKKCLGWCNGGIDMLIENDAKLKKTTAQVRTLRLHTEIEKERSDPKSTTTYMKLTGRDAFEEVYEKRFKHGPDSYAKELYYIRKSPEGAYLHFAQCYPDAPSPGCDAYMNLPSHQDVSIQYSFSMDHFKDWTAVQDAVARTVESFVVGFYQPQKRGRK